MQTHDPPIVSHTKLTSRLRCIPLPNSYRYRLGLGLCLSLSLGLGLCLSYGLGLCLSLEFGFNTSTVKWWTQKETAYPTLCKIAYTYLIAQATSVASKRIFSTACNILSNSRDRLSNDKVDKLVF